jgi:chromosome segregation ATPase
MAEKVTSMRLNDEDLEQFKAFAKDNGLNQQQAFNSLIALAELEKAKNVLGTRATSIDSFRSTVTTLINFYVNSLEENTTTEQTIREELQKELSTKDNTISALYEQVQDLKANKINSDNSIKEIESKNKELQDQLTKANNEIIEKNKSIDIANRNNNNLQDQVAEYKQYKESYKVLEKDLEQLKADHEALKDTNNKLSNDNELLTNKINNNTDMIEFYKSNNIELKANIKSLEDKYNNDIKSLEEQHKQQVLDVKDLYKDTLDNKINELNNKNDIEVAKNDLEIQKLKNDIEQLKVKDHKPGTVKTNNNNK